jgi:lambda repressor-like predicted transcriptional regulator
MSGGERMQRAATSAVMFADSDSKTKDWRSLPRPSRRGKSRVGTCRWRGRLTIPKHAHPLVRRLILELNRQSTTMQELAERSGVHLRTIQTWRHKNLPKIDLLEACFNTLGMRLIVQEIDE